MKKHSTSKKNIQENLESKVNFKHYLNRSYQSYSVFPKMRLRRLRKNEAIRDLLQETHLSIKDLVVPLFVPRRNQQKCGNRINARGIQIPPKNTTKRGGRHRCSRD